MLHPIDPHPIRRMPIDRPIVSQLYFNTNLSLGDFLPLCLVVRFARRDHQDHL